MSKATRRTGGAVRRSQPDDEQWITWPSEAGEIEWARATLAALAALGVTPESGPVLRRGAESGPAAASFDPRGRA